MRNLIGSVVATAIVLASPVRAQVVQLRFDALPSAQGWQYSTSGRPEASIFSVDGTTLRQNSMGTGMGGGGTAFQSYVRNGIVSTTKPFVLGLCARI